MPAKRKNILVKTVTFALFGMLIASFAVWGIGDIFRAPAQIRAVAEVGEQTIHQQDYARALNREINRVGRRFGTQLEIDQARALGIPDQVLSQLIGRALFDQKAAGMNMLVTDAQVRRLVHQEPAFQNALGEFDRSRFDQQLRNLGMGEGEYIQTLRRDITRQQIAGAVSEAVAAPRQLAEALYRYREERRVARVIVVPNDSITDLPAPDPAALEAFHKEFSESFMAPERRGVTLIQLRVEDLAAEVTVSEIKLREEFEARFEDLVTPEKRSIEQIMFDDEEAAREAETRLDGGADFATVAREMTGADPVGLGALERGDLPAELAEAAFSIEAEVASAPLESPLGWHILRVLKVEPAKEPIFADVRERLARDIAMTLAVESRDSIANQLDDELAAGATIEEAGRSLGLTLRYIDSIDRQGNTPAGEPIENLPPGRFLAVAFETAAGTESLLTESGDGDYFILRVDGVTSAQLRPLDQVREQVVELWSDARRADLAREKAEALAERAKVGNELETLAAEAGLVVSTTAAITRFETASARTPSPALAAKLFRIQPGEVTTATAPEGHIVAKLIEIQPADPAANADDVATVKEGLTGALQGDLLEQFTTTLRAEYGVTVNQRMIEDLLATF